MSKKNIALHGVFLDIFGVGVFLTGDSGIGKSEIALGLISRGHRLIADDSTDFYLEKGRSTPEIYGQCPEIIKNFLEVRGLGVLNIKAMFGDKAICDSAPLQLVTHLMDFSDQEIKNSDRLHGMHSTLTVLGMEVARVVIPVAAGRNLSVLLETAVRNHRLRCQGYYAAQDFMTKQQQQLL